MKINTFRVIYNIRKLSGLKYVVDDYNQKFSRIKLVVLFWAPIKKIISVEF